MSQNPLPTWLVITLGSGGFVGAASLIFNVFKQVFDNKKTKVEELNDGFKEEKSNLEKRHESEIEQIRSNYESAIRRVEHDRDRLKQELEIVRNFRGLLEENVEAIKARGITEETNSNLRKIDNYLQQWQDNEKLLDSCRNAAHWVQCKHESWLQEISDEAINKYSNQIPTNKADKFRHDVSQYLEWLHDSLYYGLFHQFKDYVDVPAIDSPFPYRCAFRYLKQKDEFGDLTLKETKFLRDYLDELINFLEN